MKDSEGGLAPGPNLPPYGRIARAKPALEAARTNVGDSHCVCRDSDGLLAWAGGTARG